MPDAGQGPCGREDVPGDHLSGCPRSASSGPETREAHSGSGTFHFGEEDWLGDQAFLQDPQNKSEGLLIWGRGVMRRGQAWDVFVVLFFFLIYGLISLLRYYALVPVLSVFLVVGLVWFSNLACGLGQLAFSTLCSKLCSGGTIIL